MPIQILPPRLANQIAAGEVVERPASVVKELVENSLDAGASKIEIELEKGGTKLIRIRDNGSGVAKEELQLALSRHATSKVTSLDDLEAIISLGFRGEALASISSVSRLTFSSCTAEQSEGWQACTEGRDMAVKVQPVAHPVGTSVEVADLFFNTPARRRFLRSEKTEFGHIEELVKRLALSHFEVHFSLKHNGKVVKNFRPALTLPQQEKRVAAICSNQFMQHALAIKAQHGDLALSGWIIEPQGARAQNDVQYCYVNGRMMRDKLINHAIRQAYADKLPSHSFAGFIIYIQVDPAEVDVNVHPAKHEVRFHQGRLVHDFILQTLNDALLENESSELNKENLTQLEQGDISTPESIDSTVVSESHGPYTASPRSEAPRIPSFSNSSGKTTHGYRSSSSATNALNESVWTQAPPQLPVANDSEQQEPITESSLGVPLTLIDERFLLLQGKRLQLLSLVKAWQLVTYHQLLGYFQQGPVSQPLLLPVSVCVGAELLDVAKFHQESLNKLGLQLKTQGNDTIIVCQVPPQMRNVPQSDIVVGLLQQLAPEMNELAGEKIEAACWWLAGRISQHKHTFDWLGAQQLMLQLQQQLGESLTAHSDVLLRQVDLATTIKSFDVE
ncbi:DNA mismatch repair endonuclease MutL [Motilimonas sp. 1_MG-2023]|uniref:DNA mismatch repair endonuclease MutL n=1 Tax=Motilimonas sp. 1_MG-2023 TaxID=3062672 RepID=UPI0026E487D7|nr:DNA mismatch repair endonuclease MutL [Motilimonas sp. 1_MG-2023]MDO6527767.1 DNA mismatch repair endonuclease MutL [Motilimonas sp. 1_MG-2023]